MPESNGGSEYSTGNSRVDEAMSRLRSHMDERFQILEDTLTVQAFLEQKASERIREHALFIAKHDVMMSEFDGKLNAVIGTLDQFREGLQNLSNRQS